MSAPQRVQIGYPGWADTRIVEVALPSMSWRTDGPGTFTTQADVRELRKAGIRVLGRTDGIKGRWLWYEHPTAGAWGGVITATDVDGPLVTLFCEQFAVLLRKRTLSSRYIPESSSPGSVAMGILTASERHGEALGLTSWSAYEGGQMIDYEPRGGDLCDEVIPELASLGGLQWRVRSTAMDERAFEMRPQVGVDRSRTCLLVEGRHVPDPGVRVSGDLWNVANAIEGINADQPNREARGYVVEDQASIKGLRRRYEESIAYSGVSTRSTVVHLVKRDLTRKAWPVEFAVVDVIDEDGCYGWFAEGDTISIQSSSADIHCPMTVEIRTLDLAGGIMQIAGELLVGSRVE
jgi:hypothetical protein